MKTLEDSVLKSFESIENLSKQQEVLQSSLAQTNERLVTISDLLEAIAKEKVSPMGSPERKKKKKLIPPKHIEPGDDHPMEEEQT